MLINIHGFVLALCTPSPSLMDIMIRPFRRFLCDSGDAAVTVSIHEHDPPYASLPTLRASFSTPRNIVYRGDDMKVIDYFGKGIVVETAGESVFHVHSRDHNFLREAFYLMVLSLFGQHCDRNRMLRIHAMALSYRDTAILLPITPGGGKSTMAMAMLERDGIKLISDDEPVLDRHGFIHPFQLRIGVLDGARLKDVPDEYIYAIDRMEFGLKHFIDCEYWSDRLETRALRKCILFRTYRQLNGTAAISPASKSSVFKTLIRDAVIGIGIYQGLEFIVSHSTLEVFSKIRLAANRTILAARLTRSASTYEMAMSSDVSANADIFHEFIGKAVCV